MVDEIPDTVVIHKVTSDVTTFNYHDVDINDLTNRIFLGRSLVTRKPKVPGSRSTTSHVQR